MNNTLSPTQEEIAIRAYHLFVDGGCQHGRDAEYWLQAERELGAKFFSPEVGADGANYGNGNGAAALAAPPKKATTKKKSVASAPVAAAEKPAVSKKAPAKKAAPKKKKAAE